MAQPQLQCGERRHAPRGHGQVVVLRHHRSVSRDSVFEPSAIDESGSDGHGIGRQQLADAVVIRERTTFEHEREIRFPSPGPNRLRQEPDRGLTKEPFRHPTPADDVSWNRHEESDELPVSEWRRELHPVRVRDSVQALHVIVVVAGRRVPKALLGV